VDETMASTYHTPEEAKKDLQYMEALTELLFQLADDDLIISHRGSEWIGLAPHIEEDVAYSSITQNTMGHALMYYQMLEELGLGRANDLAQLREPNQYRNAILTERPNGEGHYKENPNYDWAYAVVRNYVYEVYKKVRLGMLEESSYAPLADVAKKVTREQFYHLYHWDVWLTQLSQSTEEAKKRITQAVEKVWKDLATLIDLGPKADAIVANNLLKGEREIREALLQNLKEKFESVGLEFPGEPAPVEATGREGKHTSSFEEALSELSEVYRMDPQANW
jgi:ring-1,2-phenylacetyl-CoA epoxidase subunit PaaC